MYVGGNPTCSNGLFQNDDNSGLGGEIHHTTASQRGISSSRHVNMVDEESLTPVGSLDVAEDNKCGICHEPCGIEDRTKLLMGCCKQTACLTCILTQSLTSSHATCAFCRGQVLSAPSLHDMVDLRTDGNIDFEDEEEEVEEDELLFQCNCCDNILPDVSTCESCYSDCCLDCSYKIRFTNGQRVFCAGCVRYFHKVATANKVAKRRKRHLCSSPTSVECVICSETPCYDCLIHCADPTGVPKSFCLKCVDAVDSFFDQM